jgi:hypothetical protein
VVGARPGHHMRGLSGRGDAELRRMLFPLWSGFIAGSFGPATMPRGKAYWRHEEDQG